MGTLIRFLGVMLDRLIRPMLIGLDWASKRDPTPRPTPNPTPEPTPHPTISPDKARTGTSWI